MRFYKLLLIGVLGVACTGLRAQTLSVTATITDSDGTVWADGSWSAQLVNPGGGNLYYQGSLVNPPTLSGSLSSSGVLSGTFYNTNVLTPIGAQYRVTICSLTSAPCSSFMVPVTTTNMSAAFSSQVAAPRFPAGPLAFGYNSNEIYPSPNPGQGYFNNTTNTSYQWTGSAWQGGGEGGAQGPTGATGATGPQGTAGTNGTNGAAGATGATGPNAVTNSTTTTLSGYLVGNGSAVSTLPNVADTQVTVGTTAVPANSCLPSATTYFTVNMVGLTNSMTAIFMPSANYAAVIGWSAAGGTLYFNPYPTAGVLNYQVCNNTSASITPSASTVWNVSVR